MSSTVQPNRNEIGSLPAMLHSSESRIGTATSRRERKERREALHHTRAAKKELQVSRRAAMSASGTFALLGFSAVDEIICRAPRSAGGLRPV